MSLDGQVLMITFVAIALNLLIRARETDVVIVEDKLHQKDPLQRTGWFEYTDLSSQKAPGSGWQKAVYPDDLKRITERMPESPERSRLRSR
jgi:hypothetical protein